MNKIAVGQRVEGKTTLGVWDLLERHFAVVAFDPRGMINGKVVSSPEELEEAIQAVQRGEYDQRAKGIIIVYRFTALDLDEEFSQFCNIVAPPGFPYGGFGLLIDESGRLQTAQSVHPELARIMTQHPTGSTCPPDEQIDIFQTMHTLGSSWAQGRSIIDEMYFFRLTAPGDLKALKEYTHNRVPVELVEGLPEHHYVKYFNSRRKAGEPEYVLVDNPKSWNISAVSLGQPKKDVDKYVWESSNPIEVL